MSLTFSKISRTELQEIENKKWQELAIKSGVASVFQYPYFNSAWWKSFGIKCRSEIFIACDGQEWVGILPFAIKKSFGVKTLMFSASTQADFHDILAVPQRYNEVLELFKKPIKALLREVDFAVFSALPQSSGLFRWLECTFHCRVFREASPYIPTNGLTYDQIEKTWNKPHRNDVRRQEKRLRALENLRIKSVKSAEEARFQLEALKVLLVEKWKKSKSLKRDPTQIIDFFQQLLNDFWMCIHFTILYLGEKPISYHFGFLFNSTLTYYRPLYSREYEKYSPGKVHLALLIKEACEKGYREIDLSIGREPYKYSWSSLDRRLANVYIPIKSITGKIMMWWISVGEVMLKKFIINLLRRMH